MLHKRTITAGTILGAGLLGSLFAMGQDNVPRPRPVAPPPVIEEAPLPKASEEKPAPKLELPPPELPATKSSAPEMPAPEAPTPIPTTVPQDKGPELIPVQNARPSLPETATKKDDLPPPAPLFVPPAPPKQATPPAPLRGPLAPLPPTSEPLPPPIVPPLPETPVAPPAPKLESAPPVPMPAVPTVPEPTRSPEPPKTIIMPSAPDITPPASEPAPEPSRKAPASEPSRFIVQPRSAARVPPAAPMPEPAAPAPLSTPPAPMVSSGHGIPYFQPVGRPVAQPTIPSKVPGPLPKIPEIVRPTVPEVRPSLPDTPKATVEPVLGVPTPQLTVEKRGPVFQKAGDPLKYQIVLRNIGSIAAQSVRVEDEIPGAQLVSAMPPTSLQNADRIVWVLSTLRPGEERIFVEELQPIRSGDVVSTTSVHVFASTSFRTKLEGEVAAAPVATTSPPQLTAPGPFLPPTPTQVTPTPGPKAPPASDSVEGGPSLTPQIPTPTPTPQPQPTAQQPSLPPNPVAQNPTLSPAPPMIPQTIPQQMPMSVEVKALPVIQVGKRLVFEVSVTNTSSAPLTNLELFGSLPRGLSHPKGDTIGADLPDVPPGSTKVFKMPVMAIVPGKYTVEIRVKAAPNFELVARPVITIEGGPAPAIQQNSFQTDSLPGLNARLSSRDATIPEGGESICALRVVNTGPAGVTNVQAIVTLPEGLEFSSAPPQAVGGTYRIVGKDLVFGPLPRLQPGAAAMIHFPVRGTRTGEQILRVQMASDQSAAPIVSEERIVVDDRK